MKKFFRVIHLYLSLAAGLVIAIVCFTGAILVFEKELQQAFYKSRYTVEPAGNRLTLEQMVEKVQEEVPQATVGAVKVYPQADRSVEINISIPEPEVQEASERKEATASSGAAKPGGGAEKNAGGGTINQTAFVNPYSGQVLELYSYRETFFYQVFALHRWLLGGQGSIGKLIVGVSTFIFLFILLTGIILWWPKTRKVLSQRLKVKFDGGWKRLNHDFHIVLGFYSAIFLFIFAFTGLAWSFKWFNDGIYKVTNSEMNPPAEPPASEYLTGKPPITVDAAYVAASQAVPDAKFYNISLPKDFAGVFAVNVLPAGVHESATDNYYFDQYSGRLLGKLRFSDKNLGQRVRSTFKPVHTGSIFGLPSKVIAFITCVLGVTFPVTGVILWLNRLKKNRQKKKKQKVAQRA